MEVPAAIRRIKNIESKTRRTLRKLFLSRYMSPIECKRRRILKQRSAAGICLLLQCGRGLIVYVCVALDRGAGADWPEWIFCCRGVFAGGGENFPSATVGGQGQPAGAGGGNTGRRSAPGGFRRAAR